MNSLWQLTEETSVLRNAVWNVQKWSVSFISSELNRYFIKSVVGQCWTILRVFLSKYNFLKEVPCNILSLVINSLKLFEGTGFLIPCSVYQFHDRQTSPYVASYLSKIPSKLNSLTSPFLPLKPVCWKQTTIYNCLDFANWFGLRVFK